MESHKFSNIPYNEHFEHTMYGIRKHLSLCWDDSLSIVDIKEILDNYFDHIMEGINYAAQIIQKDIQPPHNEIR